MIVKSSVLPPRQLHNALDALLRKLPRTVTATIAMDRSFDSPLSDPGLDPVAVALTDPKHQRRLYHPKLSPKDPLDNFYSLLLFHRQDYGVFHALT